MKNVTNKIILAILAIIFFFNESEATEPWEGKFIWDNKGNTVEYGNVQQTVSAEIILSAPQEITISCLILWKEGTLVELGRVMPRQDLVSQVEGGVETFTTQFSFIDSHGNVGECEIAVHANVATLKTKITSIEDTRAARQHGTYILQKQVSE